MMDGGLQESTGESATRAAYGPGVYCTPRLHHTAFGLYAMPQDVFSDGEFHKVVCWLLVDTNDRDFRQATNYGQVEWVAPMRATILRGLFFLPNCGCKVDSPRLYQFFPDREP